MVARVKDVLLLVYGQSNESEDFPENVTGVQTSYYPNTGAPDIEGIWAYLSEWLAINYGYWVRTLNYTVGGESFITDFCGWDDPVDPDLGTVFNDADGGFDPNNYLSNGLTDAAARKGFYDEFWVIIQHGKADTAPYSLPLDSTAATTKAIQSGYYQAALESIVDFSLTESPDKIFVGATIASYNGDITYDEDILGDAVDGCLATYTANPIVIPGPKLFETLGMTYSHNAGDAHANRDGVIEMSGSWQTLLAGIL